jgi:putative Mg2+ transporter-C (MgtC) family protein
MGVFNNPELIIFGRLILAVILGALIGIERELLKKTAGIRTHALVSLGACLFTSISAFAFKEFGGAIDPSRIPSNIVVGIGFLGAGVIIFHQSKLQGITTAAGLWVAGAIGMAVGFGFNLVAIFTTFLTLLVFTLLGRFEKGIEEKTIDLHGK